MIHFLHPNSLLILQGLVHQNHIYVQMQLNGLNQLLKVDHVLIENDVVLLYFNLKSENKCLISDVNKLIRIQTVEDQHQRLMKSIIDKRQLQEKKTLALFFIL